LGQEVPLADDLVREGEGHRLDGGAPLPFDSRPAIPQLAEAG
jgi:hypothetical protein